MKLIVPIGVVIALILLGIGSMYVRDSNSVENALILEKFLKDYCREHGSYPDQNTVENRFPELQPGNEWYYWPSETRSVATFQYPMLLPLPSAPGQPKISEFFPVIYSYVVKHPCQGVF
jgi:hypothetical protein